MTHPGSGGDGETRNSCCQSDGGDPSRPRSRATVEDVRRKIEKALLAKRMANGISRNDALRIAPHCSRVPNESATSNQASVKSMVDATRRPRIATCRR